jgi:acyl-coenzyme A thioesterase PaaI-like protein
MESRTHLAADPTLCGTPVELGEGRAIVSLTTTASMAVDARGLVHGGFVFGLVDYAAMLAVNDPNVVLGAADCRFLAPVKVGDVVLADAKVTDERGRKRQVGVQARVGDRVVLEGSLTTFVLAQHVFDGAG